MMGTMIDDPSKNDAPEDLDSQPWLPSPLLRGRLFAGICAALFAGGLLALGSFIELAQGHPPGFTLAHAANWGALLPALWIVATYSAVGQEAESPGLAKSAQCLFGAIVLLDLYELATLNVLPIGWVVALWVVFVLTLIVILVLPFVSHRGPEKPVASAPSDTNDDAPQSPPAAPSPEDGEAAMTRTKAGVFGIIALVGVAVLKVLAKGGLFLKLFAARGIVRLFTKLNLDWESLAAIVALVLACVFLIWFAAAKIRLRRRLGGMASLVGWSEILCFLLALGVLIGLGVQLATAAERPGINNQELEELQQKFNDEVTIVALVASLAWTSLTVSFFAALRNRVDVDADSYSNYLEHC